MAFVLDPRLQADTIAVKGLPLCELMIMNDARYPWAILVPRVSGAREMFDLDPADEAAAWREVRAIAKAIGAWSNTQKVNIGALGNMVSQLHIHVVGRHAGDPAWPGPVWGHSPRVAYTEGEINAFKSHLEAVTV